MPGVETLLEVVDWLACGLGRLMSGLLSPDGTEYGLSEADMEASYATVKSMAEQVEADVILLRERQEAGGRVRDYLVRKRVGDNDFLEVR